MLAITGIGNLNELQVARPVKGARNLSADGAVEPAKDDVAFSPQGQEAAEVANFIRESAKAAEIRQERIEAAKESVEQGRHRVEEVVNVVAATLVGYL